MDPLRRDDIERARTTPPDVKLRQALELMRLGLELQRKKLRAADPAATEEEIDARLREWMSAPR